MRRRLTLGVGVSHRPVIEGLHGLAYTRPAAHMREYLSVLVPLLRDGSVRYRGEFYHVDGGFVVPGTSPVPVLVGALSPLMVQAAGELADGVVTWMACRAAWAGRSSRGCAPPPPGGQHRGSWPRSRSRCAMTPRRPGAPRTRRSPGTRGSTTTASCSSARGSRRPGALAIAGPAAEIEKQLSQLAELGVTEFWPVIFPVGDDPPASQQTRAFLAHLATTYSGI